MGSHIPGGGKGGGAEVVGLGNLKGLCTMFLLQQCQGLGKVDIAA